MPISNDGIQVELAFGFSNIISPSMILLLIYCALPTFRIKGRMNNIIKKRFFLNLDDAQSLIS